ncbi:MAG: hypothetical protein JRI68_01105 [Deltaproteobacteria bacterium]|nr:hypothetical protein [Deltaproteobacteria bacterium]
MHWNRSHGRPARLLVLLVVLLGLATGCDDAAKKQPGAKASGSAANTAAPAAAKQLVDLKAPAGVIAFGGVDNLQKLLADIAKAGTGMIPPNAVSPDVVLAGAQEALGLTSTDAVDLGKPIRVMVVDPKQNPEPVIATVSTKGKDKIVAALPADKKQDDGGNAYSFKTKLGKQAYVNFIGDTAVISMSQGAFAAHKPFLTELVNAKIPGGAAMVGSVVNMVSLYGADIDKGLEEAKGALGELAKAGPAAAGGIQAGQVEGLAAMLDWARTTVKELDKVVIETKLAADGGLLNFQLHPKKGSEVEKAFKMLSGRPFTLLSKLPADSSAFFAGVLDPEAASDLTDRLLKYSMTMGVGSVDLPEKYYKAMGDYWKATTGEFVMAVHPAVQGEGLALTGLMGLKDAAKAGELMTLMGEMYKEPAIAASYKEQGITMDFKPDAYKIGDVSVATTKVTMTKGMAELGPIAPLIQDMLNTHTGLGKDLGYMAYGKDGKATLEALINGKLAGGLDKAPATVRALKNAAPNAFYIMCGSPVDIAKGIHFGGKNPLAAKLADAPASKTMVCTSAGQKDGVIHLNTDVPVEQAKAIAQLIALIDQL